MALVSTRKNRAGRVFVRTGFIRNRPLPVWLSMLFAVCVIALPLLGLGVAAISIAVTQGWDAFISWYAGEFFGVSEHGYDLVFTVSGAALLLCSGWCIYTVTTFCRYKLYRYPRFRRAPQGYNRNLPSDEFHPVVISRFLNNRQLPDDIFIALLHLTALDVVRITGSLDESSPHYPLPSLQAGFFIHVPRTKAAQRDREKSLPSNIDRAAFRMLASVADSDGIITLSQLEKAIEGDFFERESALGTFSRTASRELAKARLVVRGYALHDDESRSYYSRKWLLGALAGSLPWLCLFFACRLFDCGPMPVFLIGLPMFGLLLLIWSLFEFDITDKGYRVMDECRNCKRWMNDFTALRHAEAGASVIWDDYLTYAYVLEANEALVDDLWQVGSTAIDALCNSFITQNGRPHFWWSTSKRRAYEHKWNSALEALNS